MAEKDVDEVEPVETGAEPEDDEVKGPAGAEDSEEASGEDSEADEEDESEPVRRDSAVKWALAALAGSLVMAAILWFQVGGKDAAKPADCESVASMIADHQASLQSINAVKSADAAADPNLLPGRYQEWIGKMQGYTDKISDSSIKQNAQALVDADKAFVELDKSRGSAPTNVFQMGPEEMQQYQQLTEVSGKQAAATKKLQQACPAAH